MMINSTTQPKTCPHCGDLLPTGAERCEKDHEITKVAKPTPPEPPDTAKNSALEDEDKLSQEKTQVKRSPYAEPDDAKETLIRTSGQHDAIRRSSEDIRLEPNLVRPARTPPQGRQATPPPGSLPTIPLEPFVVEAGASIGEYTLVQKIGEGGMGEIWRGSHPLIGKQVALKILRPKMAYDKEAVARFIQEARSVNAIKHKGLIDIFAFGDLPDGRPYFVMEFLEGESLAGRLAKKGPLPWSEIIDIFTQVCRALGAAHAQGIIHRDLKSENLFLAEDPTEKREAEEKSALPYSPTVKLLDFGIAKLINSDQENAQLTQAGDIFGTPAYMSPEHCRGYVDQRSDIYSLGVILYEMITGRTPFYEPGAKVADILGKQLYEDPLPPSEMVTGRKVPAEVDKAVLRILSKEPNARPQSCEELSKLIVKVLGPLAGQSNDGAKPIFDMTLRLRTKNPSASSATGSRALWASALMLLPLGVVLYLALRPTDPAQTPAPPIQPVATLVTTSPAAAPAPPKPTTVLLNVSSTPSEAEVFLDQELLGTTPLQKEIALTHHETTLRLTKEGFDLVEKSFTPNTASSFDITLNKSKTKPDKPPVIKPNKPNDPVDSKQPDPKTPDKPPDKPKKCGDVGEGTCNPFSQ